MQGNIIVDIFRDISRMLDMKRIVKDNFRAPYFHELYQLSHQKSTHQESSRPLHKWPPLATCNKYESLADDANLQIYSWWNFLTVTG